MTRKSRVRKQLKKIQRRKTDERPEVSNAGVMDWKGPDAVFINNKFIRDPKVYFTGKNENYVFTDETREEDLARVDIREAWQAEV